MEEEYETQLCWVGDISVGVGGQRERLTPEKGTWDPRPYCFQMEGGGALGEYSGRAGLSEMGRDHSGAWSL